MENIYKCYVCGKENVKLWRPSDGTKPLICASCAEARQVPMEYKEKNWKKSGSFYIGIPTGKKIPLEKWKVESNGLIPSYDGPTPNNLLVAKTDKLIVNISDISEYHLENTTLIPAIPDKKQPGKFKDYSSPFDQEKIWWKKLPIK